MRSLAFVKAHGAGNDFLIVDSGDADAAGIGDDLLPALSAALCDRHAGVGADGLEVVGPSSVPGAIARARLWNSDGSKAEISGNGTRCVAAYLTDRQDAPERFSIETGAGVRAVTRTRSASPDFEFRMGAEEGSCRVLESSTTLGLQSGPRIATTVDVGNPQCVCRVETLDFDWQSVGAEIERHPRFQQGTNVSFVMPSKDPDGAAALDARFWERGAGATRSSGTGSLGAAVAARHEGWIEGRVTVRTEGGDMQVDWDDGIGLTGPARIVAWGRCPLPALDRDRAG